MSALEEAVHVFLDAPTTGFRGHAHLYRGCDAKRPPQAFDPKIEVYAQQDCQRQSEHPVCDQILN